MKPKWQPEKKRTPLPCDRKRSYNTYAGAVAMAIHRVESGVVAFLRAYQCPEKGCGKYHLTSKRRNSGPIPRKFPGFEGREVDE